MKARKETVIVERSLLIDEHGQEEVRFALYSIGSGENLMDVTDISEDKARTIYALLHKHFDKKEMKQ